MDLEKYADIYFGGKHPENIKFYFLKEQEYEKTYKEISKRIFGRSDTDYKGSCGYCFYEFKEDLYHVLIRDYDGNYENVYILNLFHELGHVETMSRRIGAKLFCSSGKKNNYAAIGYSFWREYIAQYEAINHYQMYIAAVDFLETKEKTKKVIERLLEQYEDFLYEIVLYSEIMDVYIDGTEEESKKLISILKAIKLNFKSKEDLKNISIKELDKIGQCVNELYEIFERKTENV